MKLARSFLSLMLVMAPTVGWAQTVWIQNNDKTSAPNLGIGGSTAPTSPANAPSPPPAAPTQIPPQIQALLPSASTTPQPSPTLPITPLYNDQKPLRPGTIPTMVVHEPDPTNFLAARGTKFPYALTMAVDGRSLWSGADIERITKTLGISRDKVSSSCSITLAGLMKTDRGTYLFDGGTSSQMTVRYDGVIVGYMMGAKAVCLPTDKLRPDLGLVHEMNGRYLVPLNGVKCPPPKRQVSKLTISYNANDDVRCFYQ